MSTEDLADRLASIGEEIADLVITEIRDTIERGGEGRSDQEKLLTRARRSIDKAEHLLRQADS